MTRFVRFESQLDKSQGAPHWLVFRATVYAEGTLENPGEVWMSSSGWCDNQDAPHDWLDNAYPELSAEWARRYKLQKGV